MKLVSGKELNVTELLEICLMIKKYKLTSEEFDDIKKILDTMDFLNERFPRWKDSE